MSMVSVDMIANPNAPEGGGCEDFGLCGLGQGPIAQDTGGKWKWKGGKSGERDMYGRLYGSPVEAPAPSYPPAGYGYPYFYPPQVYPGFVAPPFSWASVSPYYRTQTPASAFSPFAGIAPYNPSNTDTIVPTTGPAASSYFQSQFVDVPPGTPAYVLDLRPEDDFDTGMEGLAGAAEDLEAQAAMMESTGNPALAQAAQALRQQAASIRATAAAPITAPSGPSSQDISNIIQGAGAAAAGLLKAYQEGRVNVRDVKTASGFSFGPQPAAYVPPPPSPAVPGWALGAGVAAAGLLLVLATSRR